MKRTIFLLTLLAAVTMSAKAYVPGDIIYLDGIEYYVEFPPSEGVRVRGFSYGGDGGGITNVVIPETVYGYRVTSIGNGAFKEKTGIRTVKLPAGINRIGGSAFEDCSNLTEVTLPAESGITEIEDYAFSGCTSLTEITIPPSVSKIGSHTFDGCNSLTTVNIFDLSAWCNIDFYPDYKVSYGYVYSNPLASNENAKLCLNGELITDLVIPEDVTEVKPGAFNFYKGLKSVTVHPGLAKIGEKSFNWCDNLEAVHISDLSAWCRIDFDDDSANPVHFAHNLYLNGELVTDLIIPDDITEVKDYAFYGCSGLTSIVLGDGIEEFGGNSYDNAFYGCDISEIILLDDSFEYLNKIEGIADGANVYGFIYGADAPSGVRYRQLELDIPDYTYTGHGPEYISVLENTSSYRIECTGVDGDESIDVGSHDATTAEVCVYNKEDAGSRSTTYHVTLPKKYSYTVNKAPLTVTAESFSVDYGETVAADDFWYSYGGFVNGEDEDVLTELPVIECEAASIPEAGEYPITVSGGEAKNYEFKYEQGTLTVLQIPHTMVWDQDLSDLSVGDMVVLTAEASSGMPVSYSVSNGDVVEIVKSGGKMRLHCLSPGTVTVTATEQESRNYLPVSLEKEVTVTAFGGAGTVDAGAVGCYPNPAVERLNVTGTTADSVIRIFDLNGRLLGTLKGEDGTTAVDVSGLAQGDYLLVVATGGKTATLRFTKK